MADIKILMVADGANFSFGPEPNYPADNWFSLSQLVKILEASTSPSIKVDTAHRCGAYYSGLGMVQTQGFPDLIHSDASLNLTYPGDFTFVTPPAASSFVTADLGEYDELWLMGYEESPFAQILGGPQPGTPPTDSQVLPITDAERVVIAKFMNAGGGVFAVGDHDGLGSCMSDQLLRVRTMRKWFAWYNANGAEFARNWNMLGPADPSSGQTDRFDSLQPDGNGSGNYYFDDQSDPIPQPTYDQTGVALPMSTLPIHPILRDRTGAVIASLPDHMHEGEATDFNTVSATGAPFDPNDATGAPLQITYSPQGQPSVSFVEFPAVTAADGLVQPAPQIVVYGKGSKHGNIEPYGSDPDPVTSAKPPTGKLSVYDGREVGVGRIVTSSTLHHFIDLNLTGNKQSPQTYAKTPPLPVGTDLGLPPAVMAQLTDYYVNIATWLARPNASVAIWTVKSMVSAAEAAAAGSAGFTDAFYLVFEGYPLSEVEGDLGVNFVGPFVTACGGAQPQPSGPAIADAASQRLLIPYTLPEIPAGAFPGANGAPIVLELEAQATVNTAPVFAQALIELVAGQDPFFQNVDATVGNPYWLSQDLRVFQYVPGGAPSLPSGVSAGASGYDLVTSLLSYLNGDVGFTAGPPGPVDPFAGIAGFDPVADETSISPSVFQNGVSVTAYNIAIARVRLTGSSSNPPAQNVRVFFRLFTTPTNDTDFDPQTTYPSSYDAAGLPDRPEEGVDGWTLPFFATSGGSGDYSGASPVNQKDLAILDGYQTAWAYFGCYLDLTNLVLPGTHHCLVAEIAYDQTPILGAAGITPSPETCDKLAQRNLQITGVGS